MKINNLNKFPEGYHYPYGNLEKLSDEYDLRHLEHLNLDQVWYWYASGDYEGSGQILMRRGDMYDISSLSHCSCYGPCEGVTFNGVPLEELQLKMSTEYYSEVKDLIEAAKNEDNE